MATSDLATRILTGDASLWGSANSAPNRGGWIELLAKSYENLLDLTRWAESIDQSKILVLGSGAVAQAARTPFDFLLNHKLAPQRQVVVIDSTDPRSIADVDLSDTAVIVSSSSGTTMEDQALFGFFYARLRRPERFFAITEANSTLDVMAREMGFKRVFNSPEKVGERFSAFAEVGLVPAALAGMDLFELIEGAKKTDVGSYVALGEMWGANANTGVTAVEMVHGREDDALAAWSEQMLALGSAQHSNGLLPVSCHAPAGSYPRSHFAFSPKTIAEFAQHLYGVQFAAAAAGYALGIDPFWEYEPGADEAHTLGILSGQLRAPTLPESDFAGLGEYLTPMMRPGEYATLSAYQPLDFEEQLNQETSRLAERLDANPLTAGLAPRHIYSTGRFHTLCPIGAHVVQVVSRDYGPKVTIPEMDSDFNTLIVAQADAQALALIEAGKNVTRIYN